MPNDFQIERAQLLKTFPDIDVSPHKARSLLLLWHNQTPNWPSLFCIPDCQSDTFRENMQAALVRFLSSQARENALVDKSDPLNTIYWSQVFIKAYEPYSMTQVLTKEKLVATKSMLTAYNKAMQNRASFEKQSEKWTELKMFEEDEGKSVV